MLKKKDVMQNKKEQYSKRVSGAIVTNRDDMIWLNDLRDLFQVEQFYGFVIRAVQGLVDKGE